jgi:hypothetical protein
MACGELPLCSVTGLARRQLVEHAEKVSSGGRREIVDLVQNPPLSARHAATAESEREHFRSVVLANVAERTRRIPSRQQRRANRGDDPQPTPTRENPRDVLLRNTKRVSRFLTASELTHDFRNKLC